MSKDKSGSAAAKAQFEAAKKAAIAFLKMADAIVWDD